MYFKSCTLIPQIGKLTLVQYQKTLLELQFLEVIRQYKICRGKFSIKNFQKGWIHKMSQTLLTSFSNPYILRRHHYSFITLHEVPSHNIVAGCVSQCVLLRCGCVSLTILTFLPHSIHPKDILHFPNAKGYEQNHKKLSLLQVVSKQMISCWLFVFSCLAPSLQPLRYYEWFVLLYFT